MAEITRTETRVQRRNSLDDSESPASTEITTVVISYHGGTAGMVRDFVKALGSAGASDSTLIEARRSAEGHLTGLAARWTEHVDPPDPPAS